MVDQAATAPLSAAEDMRRRVKAILIGSVGNMVEYYDIYAYTAFALYFGKAFFPDGDPVTQQVNTALVFWAGFVWRPVGGWLFGVIADRHGRRLSLMLSVILMSLGSLVIAVTPTYASIGIAAPIILALARAVQGLSLGGEYGASATYLSEVADQKHRGFYSSFQYVTLIGGQVIALVVLLMLQKVFLTPEELRAWGWRIPFVIGALLSVFAAIMRTGLHETEQFESAKKEKRAEGSLAALFRYPREVALVIGLTLGGTTAFYTYTTYMQKFLKLTVHLTDDQSTIVSLGALLFALVLQPTYGAISDRIGRKWLLIGFGVSGTLLTIPLLTTLQAVRDPLSAFLLIAAAWMIVSGYTSINAVVKAELFPTGVRALGVGLPYALTVTIFGNSVDFVALKFKDSGIESGFYWYLTGCIAMSLVVYVFMRDTKKESLIDRA